MKEGLSLFNSDAQIPINPAFKLSSTFLPGNNDQKRELDRNLKSTRVYIA